MIIESDDDAARELARIMRESLSRFYVSRSYATVVSVAGSRCSIRFDGETDEDPVHDGVLMTTSCAGVGAGDRVMVDTVDHLSTVTGVLSKGDQHGWTVAPPPAPGGVRL